MAGASVPTAESEFASWYASLGVQIDPEIRQNRWNGVIAATDAAKRKEIETFIRCCLYLSMWV